jgi:beta-1,4-N-acetylglucosaminyltransferase
VIFVTIGSTDFDPLIQKMDELAPSLGEPVVMQIGDGVYTPQHGEAFRFAESLDRYYDQADIIVAHGGLGTIVEVLERGKKLVCVVNPTTYDRHQEHLLHVFVEQNHLLWCRDLDHLAEAIQQARDSSFAPYQVPQCHIHEVIKEYLATGAKPSVRRGAK